MTFREFLEEAKKEGIEELGREKQWILNALQSEGFTEEQIYSMKMERVWKFLINHLSVYFDEGLTEISMALQQGMITPEQQKLFMKESEKMIEQIEEFNKELKETLKKKKAKTRKETQK